MAKAQKSRSKKKVAAKEKKVLKEPQKKDSLSHALSPLAEDLAENAQAESQQSTQPEKPQESRDASSLGLPQESSETQDAITNPPLPTLPSQPTNPAPSASPVPLTSQQSSSSSPASGELAPLGSTPSSQQTPAAPPKPTSQTPAAQPTQTAQNTSTDLVITSSDEDSGGTKKAIFIIFIILLLIIAVLGGVFYFVSTYKGTSEMEKEEAQSPLASKVSPTPKVATDSANLNLADFTIQVLNGSGTPGQAGVVSDLLKEAGFEDIETGNADAYTYDETEVSIGRQIPEAIYTAIEKALSDSFIVTKSAEFRKVSSTYDAIIIVGSKSPEESSEEE